MSQKQETSADIRMPNLTYMALILSTRRKICRGTDNS